MHTTSELAGRRTWWSETTAEPRTTRNLTHCSSDKPSQSISHQDKSSINSQTLTSHPSAPSIHQILRWKTQQVEMYPSWSIQALLWKRTSTSKSAPNQRHNLKLNWKPTQPPQPNNEASIQRRSSLLHWTDAHPQAALCTPHTQLSKHWSGRENQEDWVRIMNEAHERWNVWKRRLIKEEGHKKNPKSPPASSRGSGEIKRGLLRWRPLISTDGRGLSRWDWAGKGLKHGWAGGGAALTEPTKLRLIVLKPPT